MEPNHPPDSVDEDQAPRTQDSDRTAEPGRQGRWEVLRRALKKRSEDGVWWEEGDISEAISEAARKGIDPDLILQCRQASAGFREFSERLRRLIDAPEEPGASPDAAGERRILAVDDDVEILDSLRMNFERLPGYRIRTEHEAAGVLEAARAFRPHLILLDVVMPDRDGMEVLAELRADESLRGIPVIMLTALAEGVRSGAVAKHRVLFLEKPVRMKRLLHCIDDFLRP